VSQTAASVLGLVLGVSVDPERHVSTAVALKAHVEIIRLVPLGFVSLGERVFMVVACRVENWRDVLLEFVPRNMQYVSMVVVSYPRHLLQQQRALQPQPLVAAPPASQPQ
jgi:hypothetical protein